MRLSEFKKACADEFGADYAAVVLRDYWLPTFAATADDAILGGVPAREVWLALCAEFDVPAERRYGVGISNPAK